MHLLPSSPFFVWLEPSVFSSAGSTQSPGPIQGNSSQKPCSCRLPSVLP